MQERDFKKLLLETIKFNDYEDKEHLIELLKLVNLRFETSGEFTRHLWNHYKEYLYLYIIPQRMPELLKYKDQIEKICYDIYQPNDEYELWDIFIKPGNMPLEEEVSQEILFENIQSQIIDEIRGAKFLIWVAVAWFTDPLLYNELVKKKKQGLNIQIVIDDNDRNRNVPFKLEDEFETYRVSIKSLYKNTMHHKFCIIDLVSSIHGSFNWTMAAQYNKETISVDHNRETAECFANEFLKLKRNQIID